MKKLLLWYMFFAVISTCMVPFLHSKQFQIRNNTPDDITIYVFKEGRTYFDAKPQGDKVTNNKPLHIAFLPSGKSTTFNINKAPLCLGAIIAVKGDTKNSMDALKKKHEDIPLVDKGYVHFIDCYDTKKGAAFKGYQQCYYVDSQVRCYVDHKIKKWVIIKEFHTKGRQKGLFYYDLKDDK